MRSTRPPSSGTDPASPPPLHAGVPCLVQAPARPLQGPPSDQGPPPDQGPPSDQGRSQQVPGALQGPLATMLGSTEDPPDKRETGDRLHRGFSTAQQDVREVSMTTLPTSEALQQPDRPMTAQTPEGHAPSSDPAHHHYQGDVIPAIPAFAAPQGASESHPPVTRRERPHISSPLAASVGLPSPLPHPTSPSPRPASPLYHPVTSAPRLLNTNGNGVTVETMTTAVTEDSDRVNRFSLPLPPSPPSTQHCLSSLRTSESHLLSLSEPSEVCQSENDTDEVFPPFPHHLPITESDITKYPPPPPPQQEVLGAAGGRGSVNTRGRVEHQGAGQCEHQGAEHQGAEQCEHQGTGQCEHQGAGHQGAEQCEHQGAGQCEHQGAEQCEHQGAEQCEHQGGGAVLNTRGRSSVNTRGQGSVNTRGRGEHQGAEHQGAG
ncbi:unnamed protein product [Gadus morhua 'NCC']